MSQDKPKIVDLRKQATVDEEDEEHLEGEDSGDVYQEARDNYPENMEDGSPEDTQSGNAYNEARESYPEDAEEANKGEESEEEKAFSIKNFNLNTKFDEEKGFGDLKEGNVVLIETPLEGAKIGEVVGKQDSWTGTLQVKVDTGANSYEVTPYQDEFSERLIACLDDSGEVTEKLLSRLGKTDIGKVEVGNQVIIDAPHVGPIRGTIAHTAKTETQGRKVDVNTGPATFTIYEDPSPAQKKEQSVIIGQITG